MPVTVLDIEQHLLLLELEAPFNKRDVQLARRRMAKRWHPDVAPAGRQFEHERHLKAINEAADQLERLAEGSRGGHVSRNAARVRFSHGVRTVPAGSMRFVDFSKPDPAEERVERFMLAAQRAMAEGEYMLAAQRLIYARDAEPRNVAVLRLMTLAFWQAGKLEEAARAVRDWARVDGRRPAAHRFAARIYEDMGAVDLAEEAAERAAHRGPADAGAWERLGRLRLRLMDREGALGALRDASRLGANGEVRDLIAQALAIEPGLA